LFKNYKKKKKKKTNVKTIYFKMLWLKKKIKTRSKY